VAGGITAAVLDLLARYGYLSLFVFLFLETSMLFPLVPSEVAVPFAAACLVVAVAASWWTRRR
jgi:membrane protein DedA with SNARE-associated domain